MRVLIQSIRVAAVTLVLTGLAYPLAMTGLAQLLFPHRAGGSLVADEKGRVVGSELIAQPFSAAGYLQPRPSAAGDKGYDPLASGGSNMGPTSAKLRQRVADEVKRLRAENPEAPPAVPAELVTTSGSGLDPHLSPGAAAWQAWRIAAARGVERQRVLGVIEELTEGRDLGFLGEPRVNVLAVNLALDRRFGTLVLPSPTATPTPSPTPTAVPASTTKP
jgi:K+-transporting ATPase ATPase C chain